MVTSTRRCIPGGTLGQVPEASSRPGRSGTDICTYDLTQELWPGAYKRVSQRSRPVPGPAVSAEIKTMAARKSTLFPLGLGLCLGVLFASASSAERNDTCHFTEVFTPGPGIKANLDVYKNNTVYTVSVPVNSSISSVVLRALDTNHHPVGHWQKADEHCNSSALYHMKDSHRVLFQADWVSPNSTNVTTVELQAFVVSLNNTATLSSLKLTSIVTTTTLTSTRPTTLTSTRPTTLTSKRSTTLTSTKHTLTSTRPTTLTSTKHTTLTSTRPTTLTSTRPTTLTSTRPTTLTSTTPKNKPSTHPTPPTTRSLANSIFLGPMRGATQLLLVFLTSKLLF
ncbi:placenta-expressed transcript 1 protein [Manis pentadactyla]|uniref:placenta-expressed transcript 1 protein n=1 Tax=Manis pentadactyla TaxID=143292 RepID=UPI00255CEA18|nr:placenta-expressed transcript 1 protein [Manis pentadactyla]